MDGTVSECSISHRRADSAAGGISSITRRTADTNSGTTRLAKKIKIPNRAKNDKRMHTGRLLLSTDAFLLFGKYMFPWLFALLFLALFVVAAAVILMWIYKKGTKIFRFLN